ncbi:MAG: hypothetical protein ACPG5L_07510 [Vibrio gallaecicus]
MTVLNSYDLPHFLVSGVMRSGTSMMMHALGQSIPVYWRPRENEEKWQGIGHHCYEPPIEDQNAESFPFHPLYAGNLIKCFYTRIMNLTESSQFYIVYMLRDYEEIKESMKRVFETDNPIRERSVYESTTQGQIKALSQKKNVNLTVFNYQDVLDRPLEAFVLLRENGWPIMPDKCAAVVQPNKKTVRL